MEEVRKRTEGHPIAEDQQECTEGHPASTAAQATSVSDPIAMQAMMLQTQQMMQQTMNRLLQNLSTSNASPGGRVKRPDRPVVDVDSTDGDWALFIDSWKRYKTMTKMNDPLEIRNELRSTCSPVINKLLFDFVGPETLNTCSEQQLLQHIKSVAVKGVHKEVHRQKFHTLHQSPGESITRYLARLRAQAALCEFRITCPNSTCASQVSYVDDMISGQMIAGLANMEHQSKILAEAAMLDSLQKKFDRLVSLETTDQSTSHLQTPITTPKLSGPSESAAQRSQYQQQKQPKKPSLAGKDSRSPLPCKGCGEVSHPPGKSMARKDCPAFNTICHNCRIRGHFGKVCRKPKDPQQNNSSSSAAQANQAPSPEPSVFYAQISGTSNKANRKRLHRQRQRQRQRQREQEAGLPPNSLRKARRASNVKEARRQEQQAASKANENSFVRAVRRNNRKLRRRSHPAPAQSIAIPHLVWKGSEFCKEAPEPSPTISVSVAIMQHAHKSFGRPLPGKSGIPDETKLQAFADTCAQTCTSGPEIMEQLHCPASALVPTSHGIHGITENSLSILGALLLQITAGGHQTNQVVYVAKNIKGFYLSQTAMKDLNLIPSTFPCTSATIRAIKTPSGPEKAPCGCPLRTQPPPHPQQPPLPLTEENREKLEAWILAHYASSAFNTCPHQTLQTMTGRPMNITFQPGSTPSAVHCPIPVPHHWKKAVKDALDQDVALGIIEPVPQGTPTVWCSRMVVTPKKDGTPRRTVDLQKLNQATLRETHHTPSPFHHVSTVPSNTKKTVLDAWNGYHSLPLSPEARDATTFITEWGRYRYLRAPMGFQASGDAYTKRFDDITVDMPRKTRIIDDTILWDTSIESSFWHTLEYISHCATNGIVFNPKKFAFGRDEVDFGGFTITKDGVRPTASMINAIAQFPTPTNITGVRSWFGLVNQVAYAFAQAEIMAPFRELLSTKRKKFYWDDTLDHIFEESKKQIISLIEEGVKSFEIGRPTCISSDWSKTGIGFFLRQQHCTCPPAQGPTCGNGHWKLIFAGSRFTTEAESRYAPVEGEALALIYALESCRMFVLGCPHLYISVDHQPLVAIFGERALEKISNPRLFSFKERSMMYQFHIKHTPGKHNTAPDATSRYPAASIMSGPIKPAPYECHQPDDQASALAIDSGIKSSLAASYGSDIGLKAITWERIIAAAAQDEEYCLLSNVITSGFPKAKDDLPEMIRRFWPSREEYYVIDGVILKDSRILIPQPLRAEVLECLHAAHQGVNGMLANARQRLFWPGLEANLRQTRAQCRACNAVAPSNPREPICDPPNPQFPFQHTVVDFCDIRGNKYLVFADRYTGWVEVVLMKDPTTNRVCDQLRAWFCTYGAPDELSSDGGPPFQSHEYAQFLSNWGIHQRLSSAYFAQSNGRAELAVKTAKRILMNNTDSAGRLNHDSTARAFLNHRNTPVQDVGISPAMMLFGRPIKDHLPRLWDTHSIRPQWKEIWELRERAMAKRHVRNAAHYNTHTRTLPALQVGDSVLIQNQTGHHPKRWDKTGKIVETLGNRQYQIKVDGSNRITLRNRRFLKKISPVADQIQPFLPTSPFSEPVPAQLTNADLPKAPTATTDTPATKMAQPSPPLPPIVAQHQSDNNITSPMPPSPSTQSEPVPQAEITDQRNHLPPNSTTTGPQEQFNSNPRRADSEKATDEVSLRRSKRTPRPKRSLSPSMHGQRHNIVEH